MTELTEVIQWGLKFLLIGLFALCYVWGGRGGTPKWIRRFLGSGLFSAGIIGFSFWQGCYSHFLLLLPVLLCIGLCQGYGGDSFWEKVKRRGTFGIILGLSSVPLAFAYGNWALFGIQFGLAVLASVVLGVFNPFTGSSSAVYEEGMIGLLSILFIPYMIGGVM